MSEDLAEERQALLRYVLAARKAIAELRPVDMRTRKLPNAMNEIGMIVETTETAANTIMESVEEIMGMAPGIPAEAYRTAVEAKCLTVMEACAFQDLTGQRMTKVVETLLTLEDRLATLSDVLGDHAEEIEDEPEGKQGDEVFLNGPAMPGEGVDQDDIDKLFA